MYSPGDAGGLVRHGVRALSRTGIDEDVVEVDKHKSV
jgi:hypothetical protein